MSLIFLFLSFGFHKSNDTSMGDKTCVVCDRLSLFETIMQKVGAKYWHSYNTKDMTPPPVYFDDSVSWLAFSNEVLFKNIKYERIKCASGLILYKLNIRLDTVLFHMENKMSFTDATSPYYYHPIMFCSYVETASRLIPEVKNTEEWLQMVLHEYFHAFQFNHKNSINYLADSIALSVDSLHGYYRRNNWFRGYLKMENDYLLKAIDAQAEDSIKYFSAQFFETRKQRREQFFTQFHFDISRAEMFWEKIEGTARYIEYNTGFVYTKIKHKSLDKGCDLSFKGFKNYYDKDITNEPWFYEKTQMMVGYYYVTGFNLCRLLDKLKISYKDNLFNTPSTELEQYLCK